MRNAPRPAYERLGGLDAELYALARLYLEFWDALPDPSSPDDQRVRELTSELEAKGIEIIDTYGRKPKLRYWTGHLVSLPTGNVHISWEAPESWDQRQHELLENGDILKENLGTISFAYEPSRTGAPMYWDMSLWRVVPSNGRPAGFPKWGQPSVSERLFGPRGNGKYAAQLKVPGTGWVLRRNYIFDGYDMESYLMNNNKWLECDVAPLRTQRRDHPLHSNPFHFIDDESTAQVGPKVLSEDQARKLADEKNRGYIRAHWKRDALVALPIILTIVGICVSVL